MSKEKFKVYEGVFDNYTLRTLENLKRKKYFDTLLSVIKTGKEADVYGGNREDGRDVAIKIYRITSANFKKISEYIRRDYRFRTSKGNMRRTLLQWVEKEYRNLLLAYNSGINVPFPFQQKNNVIVMERINGGMLKDCELENPKEFFDELLTQLKLLRYNANLVHGDLSEFNIMVENSKPILIDFGQGMSIKQESDFATLYDLYERDCKQIINYFNKKYKLNLDEKEVFEILNTPLSDES